MALLEIRGLSVNYGPIAALEDVSFEVGAGELVALVGSNGAGKTTLLTAISGLVPVRRGEIVFEGRPLVGLPAHAVARLGIGHVPEGRRIFGGLSVRENLELGGAARRDRAGVAADMAAATDLFPVLAARMRQPGGTLSGGEQQMLAIARALVGRPRLLLLDEPSLGLAPLVAGSVLAAVAALAARGIGVVLVEQNARAALSLATRGCVLENGRLVLAGAGAELAADPRVRAAYLGAEPGESPGGV